MSTPRPPLRPQRGITLPRMPRQIHRTTDFGPRLRNLRQERGWTQVELAERAVVTPRAINHYETSGQFPPAPVVMQLAEAFDISMDAMMGRTELKKPKPSKDDPNLLKDADDRRLWKKFRQLKELGDRDQQTVLRTLAAIIQAKGKN